MKEHKIETLITTLGKGYEYKLLPNYNNDGDRQKDIKELFYLFYNHEDEKLFFFDCENDPMPEDLKIELFSSRYLSKMNLCYALMRLPNDDTPVLVLLNLRYEFLIHYSTTISEYYDITEYPWFKMVNDLEDFDKVEFEVLEEQTIFKDEQTMIDFIISKRPMSIEDLIDEFKWNSYGDELTHFFKSNPTLSEFSNIFRVKKIQKFLKSLD